MRSWGRISGCPGDMASIFGGATVVVEARLDDRRWRILTYLYRALQYDVAVVGTGRTFEGREALVLSAERDIGAYDGLSAFGFLPEVRLSTALSLASAGYLDISPPDSSGARRLRITNQGARVVEAHQRRLLQKIYDHFRQTGEWPNYRRLGRELVAVMDVQQVAQSLPPGYINAGEAHRASHGDIERSSEATLTVPAIRLCDGSESDLSDFIQVVQLCVRRHFDSSNLETPRITRQDLEQDLGMPDLTVRKMIRLSVQEPNIYAGGLTDPDSPSWWMHISEDVGRYEGVRSIDEYIEDRSMPFSTGLPRRRFGYPVSPELRLGQQGSPIRTLSHGASKENVMKVRLTAQQQQMLRTLHNLHQERGIRTVHVYQLAGDGREMLELELGEEVGDEGQTFSAEYDPGVVESLRDSGFIGMTRRDSQTYRLWITPEGLELVDRDFGEAAPGDIPGSKGDARTMSVEPIFSGRGFATDTSQVFVFSPFREPFNTIYREHIKRAVEVLGMTCARADDIYDNRPIMEDVWRGMNEAGIIISDLTDRNPNVFYETGIAHTVGKEVILISQNSEDVPFDLKHIRFYPYSTQLSGPQKLEEDLKQAITTIRQRRGWEKL